MNLNVKSGLPLGLLLLPVQLGKFAILENVPLLELHHIEFRHPHFIRSEPIPFFPFIIPGIIPISTGDRYQPFVDIVIVILFLT